MSLITIEHLTKSYTERLLFDDTAFSINEGEKVGLIGINGTGKSTLLKIVAGLEEPDDGSVVRRRNLYIRYLPQIPVFTAGDTVLDAIVRDNASEPHFSSREEIEGGAKAPRTLRPLPLLRFAVSPTGGAHLCSIQYYLRFWLGICRTSLAVSALRIMRYCPK